MLHHVFVFDVNSHSIVFTESELEEKDQMAFATFLVEGAPADKMALEEKRILNHLHGMCFLAKYASNYVFGALIKNFNPKQEHVFRMLRRISRQKTVFSNEESEEGRFRQYVRQQIQEIDGEDDGRNVPKQSSPIPAGFQSSSVQVNTKEEDIYKKVQNSNAFKRGPKRRKVTEVYEIEFEADNNSEIEEEQAEEEVQENKKPNEPIIRMITEPKNLSKDLRSNQPIQIIDLAEQKRVKENLIKEKKKLAREFRRKTATVSGSGVGYDICCKFMTGFCLILLGFFLITGIKFHGVK